ncbi:unnamed protein product, partial [Allacma fusca]
SGPSSAFGTPDRGHISDT